MDDSKYTHSDKGARTHSKFVITGVKYTHMQEGNTGFGPGKNKLSQFGFFYLDTHKEKQSYLLFATGLKLSRVSTSHLQLVIITSLNSGVRPA